MTICEADILASSPKECVQATPQNDADDGFVVQSPSATWGVDEPYGSGQAFMVLRETGDPADEGPDGAVVYRVNRYGGIGSIGGMHIALGLRGGSGGATQAMWVQCIEDAVGMVIERPPTKDYLWLTDETDPTNVVFKITNAGQVVNDKEIVARDGASSRTVIGSTYGAAGIAMGLAADTTVWRQAAGVVGTGNASFLPKLSSEPAAQPNGVVTFCAANAAGKLQVKAKFPDGSVVVMATQP